MVSCGGLCRLPNVRGMAWKPRNPASERQSGFAWRISIQRHGGTVSDRGRTRKETIRSGAFDYSINDPNARIDLLVGHSWDKPIANRQTGSLDIRNEGDTVVFDATLPNDPPSWVTDAEKAIAAGTMLGLSPGFRVPPLSAVPGAERTVPEPGNPSVSIREINQAMLREMSVVTSAGYLDASVELRSDDLWQPEPLNLGMVWQYL